MSRIIEIRVNPDYRDDHEFVLARAIEQSGLDPEKAGARILRRSIDARGQSVKYAFRVEVWDNADQAPPAEPDMNYPELNGTGTAHIIGAGPAGYFAALEFLKHGIKPVIFERGKDVQSRRRDLRAIQQFGTVDPDSNYCFGEGGAGTYSDGKLYTRSTKRGDVAGILRTLVEHGAKSDILIDAHPHIGSNKLPGIIAEIRNTILEHGGEIHFGARVTDLVITERHVSKVILADGREFEVDNLILATGHSARDIYSMLQARNVRLEFKPFALGVRIEHPQALIDRIQYSLAERGPHLPAASYSLACQVDNRGVFSFCMCPGGLIVPAATAPGEIVLNGMSLSRRDSAYANAGTVVSVDEKMIRRELGKREVGALDGVAFQARVEKACFDAGDGSQKAPAQRLADFVDGRLSADLPDSSYIPGIYSYPVADLLPNPITKTLRAGIREFGRRMRGYLTNEAVVVATESRTSSPVRIPRDKKTLMHPDVGGLFPCGEGAGFAGGIISAAIDGQNVARAVVRYSNLTVTE